MNPQAEHLNSLMQQENYFNYSLLSRKGKEIYFPAKGILSQSSEAKGKKINATIGMAMEDDGSPVRLMSMASYAFLPPQDVFPYAPSSGKEPLRDLWLEMIRTKNPSLKDIPLTRPVVCNALTHGLNICGYLFIDPNNEIILPDLYWGNYNLIFQNAYHAKFATFPTFNDQGFNVNSLHNLLCSGGYKKVLILNFPNNPTGYTPSEQEVERIKKALWDAACMGKRILVICDDAYFGLVFEERVYKESIFSAVSNLHERILAVKVDGATKEDYAWGFRVGFITYSCKGMSPRMAGALENKTSGAVRASISSSPMLSQSILMNAYSSPVYQQEKDQKFDLIKSRYETVKQTLRENPQYQEYFTPLPYNSGYFMCFKLKPHDGEKIRRILLDQFSTGVIALGNVIRIAYSAVDKALIPELIENLYQACKRCTVTKKEQRFPEISRVV